MPPVSDPSAKRTPFTFHFSLPLKEVFPTTDPRCYHRANRVGAMLMLMALCQHAVPAVFYACLQAGGADPQAAAWGLPYASFLLLYLLMYALVMLIPTLLSRRFLMPSSARTSPLNLSSDRRMSVVLCGVALCLLANILASALSGFLTVEGITRPQDAADGTFLTLLLELVVFAVVPAVLEEWLLRATVLRTLRPLGDFAAVIVSSVLFGLIHGNLSQAPYALLMGLILGWFYLYTDDLRLVVLIHAAANALSVITTYLLRFTPSEVFGFWQAAIRIIALLLGGLAALWLCRHPLTRRRPAPQATVAARYGALFRAPLLWAAIVLMLIPLIF